MNARRFLGATLGALLLASPLHADPAVKGTPGLALPNQWSQPQTFNGTVAATSTFTTSKGVRSGGTKFTTSGCAISASTGGATAGKVTLGQNTCFFTVTMGGGATATNGWACSPKDVTAPTVQIGVTVTSSTTSQEFSVPAGAGATDVIVFSCIGY